MALRPGCGGLILSLMARLPGSQHLVDGSLTYVVVLA
jgi:hypothetical protein